MAHLIKLELKKFGITRNIIVTLAAILFSILFITVSLVDSMKDPEQTKDTFESTFLVIGLLMSFIFIVYSSALTARLIIGEYNQRTITIMFSYPLNRRQLIASKLIIIMVYTAISITIGYICCSGYIILADKYFDMLDGIFKISFLHIWIPMAVITVIVCIALGLYIGTCWLRKKKTYSWKSLAKYTVVIYLSVIVPLIFIAALVETFITTQLNNLM